MTTPPVRITVGDSELNLNNSELITSTQIPKSVMITSNTASRIFSKYSRQIVSRTRSTRFSSAPNFADTKITPILAKLQQECWDGYVATGRGCHTLFQIIDTDSSGTVSWQELTYFLKNVRDSDINAAAKMDVLMAAADGNLCFSEFQDWLIKATKVDPGLKNSYADHHYHKSIGNETDSLQRVHSWNKYTMSQNLRRMQYAVRGEVVLRADTMAAEGRKIIYTNIGNPHAVGQKPITYYRQVLALCDLPAEYGIANQQISAAFPTDVVERAIEMRSAIGPAGTGAYTNSQGIWKFRNDVAHFITERDEHISLPSNIFLSNGASAAIENVLTALIGNNRDAIMIPIPQYPIYSAIISRLGARQVGYYLGEYCYMTLLMNEYVVCLISYFYLHGFR